MSTPYCREGRVAQVDCTRPNLKREPPDFGCDRARRFVFHREKTRLGPGPSPGWREQRSLDHPAEATPSVRMPLFLLSMLSYGCVLSSRTGVGMGKPFTVCALCVISAALGAAVDHYFAGAIEQGGPHLERAVSPKAAIAAPAEMNVEVLGDRVKCDVRYQEMKIPASEYQSFKRTCTGDKWSD